MNARIKTNKAPIASEHAEQVALMHWATMMEKMIPELALLYAIPNGGKRHVVVASKLRREGVKPGVPDLCLPVSRGGYHGLYIELKRKKNGQLTPVQNLWIDLLTEQGYKAIACHGWEVAKYVLVSYLGMPSL